MANTTYTTQDLILLALKKNLLNQEKLSELTEQKIVNLDREKFLDKMLELGLFTEAVNEELKKELLELNLFNSNPTLIKQHNELAINTLISKSEPLSQEKVKTLFNNNPVEQDPLKTFIKEKKNTNQNTLFSTAKSVPTLKPIDEEGTILRKVGRYEVLKLLGEGGMGSVYKAYDVALDRYVALKFIHHNDEAAKKRLILEGRTQARIDHPSICKIYEIGEVDNQLFVAMQYIQGDTLGNMAKVLSLEQKVKLVAGAAEGLHAAHKEGLIHRDIKPQNIMVEKKADGSLQASVLDFGLVKEVTNKGMTMTGEILGTPCYMSPEQARGRVSSLDRRTDVYSLGISLYEILVHQLPFEGFSPMDILLEVLNKEAPLLRQIDPNIPINIETIVAKCLEKDPQRRYDSAKALAEDLNRYLDGTAIAAKPVSWSYRMMQKAKNHKIAVTSLTVALVVVLVSAAISLRTRLNAAQQASLAQQFGQEIKEIENIMLFGNVLPLHNLSREKDLVKQKIKDINKQMSKLGTLAEGPGNYALGQGYLALGDYSKAREHLEIALANGYDSPEINYSLGQTFGALYQEALIETERITNEELRKAREEQIEKELRSPALLYLRKSKGSNRFSPAYAEGLVAFYEKNYMDALEKSQKAFTEIPSLYEAKKLEGDIYVKLGDSNQEIGKYQEAKEDYKKAGEAYKVAITIGESAGNVYEGECHRYSRIMEVAIINSEKDLYQTAYTEAISACDKALIANPESATAYRKKSRVFWRRGEEIISTNQDPTEYLDKAIEMGQKAIFYNDKDIYAYNNLGNAYLQKSIYRQKIDLDPEESLNLAAENYLKAIELNPNFAFAYNGLGLVYWRRGDYLIEKNKDGLSFLNKAIESYQKSIALSPNFPAYNNIGLAAWAKGNYEIEHKIDPIKSYDFSIENLQIAIKLNPKYSISYDFLGLVYTTKANVLMNNGLDPTTLFDLAIEHGRKAIEMNPDAAEDYYNLGVTYNKKAFYYLMQERNLEKLLQEARKLLQIAYKIDPNGEDILLEQSYLELLAARWQIIQNQDPNKFFNQAKNILKKSFANEPSSELYKALAEVHLWQAEWQIKNNIKALETINIGIKLVNKALEIEPEKAEFWAINGHLVLLKAKEEKAKTKGLAKEAESLLEKATEKDLLLKYYEPLLIEARNLQK
ncbi:MAG: protein kinase [Blastocatellia bacterium]